MLSAPMTVTLSMCLSNWLVPSPNGLAVSSQILCDVVGRRPAVRVPQRLQEAVFELHGFTCIAGLPSWPDSNWPFFFPFPRLCLKNFALCFCFAFKLLEFSTIKCLFASSRLVAWGNEKALSGRPCQDQHSSDTLAHQFLLLSAYL